MSRNLFALAGAAVILFAAPAQAQKVYVNGVECTGIVSARFEGATVSFDEQGNIRIDAPGYRVQVIQPGATAPSTPPAGTTTTSTTTTTSGTGSSAGSQTVVYSDSGRAMTTGPASYNAPIVEQTTTTVVTTTGGSSGGTASTTRPTTTGTTTGTTGTTATTRPATTSTSPLTKQYFLITQGSSGASVGETIQVNINGHQVRTLDTASAQVIDDVSEFLNIGQNAITMMSTKKTSYVPGQATSTYQVIIGEGHVERGGQVVIDNPLVTYTRTAADATANSRSYTMSAR
jgi:hypothetical protein